MYDAQVGRWFTPDPLQEDEYADDDGEFVENGVRHKEGYVADAIKQQFFPLDGDDTREDMYETKGLSPENSAIHYNVSPYAYVLNNPINFIDPYGLDTVWKPLAPVVVQGKSKGNNKDNSTSSWMQHLVGPAGIAFSYPIPKRIFGAVMKNTSETTTILSYVLGKIKTPINIFGRTRLYTHTLNGSARFARTWGRFLGRWGSKLIGKASLYYTLWDATYNIAPSVGNYIAEKQSQLTGIPIDHSEDGLLARDGVCFKAGTLIYTNIGFVKVEHIKIGDSVYSNNFERSKMELSRVEKVFQRKTKTVYELITNNENIFVTSEPPPSSKYKEFSLAQAW